MIFDKLTERINWVLANQGFTIPTPIQEKVIPLILEKKDLIGIAQTGTGKTASFVLPVLHLLSTDAKIIEPNHPLVLVLSPTRELVVQIDEVFETYGKFLKIKHKAIFGGVSQEPQINSLSKGVHVLSATPGRLLDLLNQDKINLSKVEYFILDEAQIMLDMGFLKSIKDICEKLPANRQSLFFSATTSSEMILFANELLNNPVIIEIQSEKAPELISQKVFFVYVENKNALLLELIKNTKKTIVFLRTKYKTDVITNLLNKNNISAVSIHSDKSQEERNKSIEDFKSGKTKVLVATDIAARGIHIDDVSHVINYDIPNSPDVYVHRIGRTARAGKFGVAYSFCSLEERELFRKIESYTGQNIECVENIYNNSEKIKNAKSEDIIIKPKHKKGAPKVIPKKRIIESDTYIPPINQKKAKKPRGINLAKSNSKYRRR